MPVVFKCFIPQPCDKVHKTIFLILCKCGYHCETRIPSKIKYLVGQFFISQLGVWSTSEITGLSWVLFSIMWYHGGIMVIPKCMVVSLYTIFIMHVDTYFNLVYHDQSSFLNINTGATTERCVLYCT